MNENIYAVVDASGNIINIILWNGEDEWAPPEGCAAVACGENSCQIGGAYIDGKFSAPPAPIYTQEELVKKADEQKQALLSMANSYTQPWQTQLLLGMISDADKKALMVWMKYYQDLQSIDTSEAPDIKWPDSPS